MTTGSSGRMCDSTWTPMIDILLVLLILHVIVPVTPRPGWLVPSHQIAEGHRSPTAHLVQVSMLPAHQPTSASRTDVTKRDCCRLTRYFYANPPTVSCSSRDDDVNFSYIGITISARANVDHIGLMTPRLCRPEPRHIGRFPVGEKAGGGNRHGDAGRCNWLRPNERKVHAGGGVGAVDGSSQFQGCQPVRG